MKNIKNCYPYPRSLVGAFNDEEEYVDWLVDTFERFGWDCRTEVPSDSLDSRADIITEHEHWGVFGIECKYKRKLRPRNWANALKQLQRYSNEMFHGEEVANWAIATFESKYVEEAEKQDDLFDIRKSQLAAGYREFMNTVGYGVLRHDTRFELIFNNSNPMVKIPVAEIKYPTGQMQPPSVDRLKDCDTEEAEQYLM